jgi:hypothetical protein
MNVPITIAPFNIVISTCFNSTAWNTVVLKQTYNCPLHLENLSSSKTEYGSNYCTSILKLKQPPAKTHSPCPISLTSVTAKITGIIIGEISGSHGNEYEVGCFLGYFAV